MQLRRIASKQRPKPPFGHLSRELVAMECVTYEQRPNLNIFYCLDACLEI